MINRRARLSLVATVAVAGVMVTAPSGVAAPGAAAAPGAIAPPGPTVTLLTGDRVTVGGPRGATVQPAEGREQLAFYVRKDAAGDTHVIPEDAALLLSSGKLDPRLFDVSELVRAGYDDASRDTLPLIVDYPGRTPRTAGTRVSTELPAMGATAVSAEPSADFWAAAKNAEHVWLDGPVKVSLDRSVAQIGAPAAWQAGHTGAGTTVAVLDTGIDVTHPDLSDAVAGEQNFTDSDTADDMFGHGTHVASTITGKGDEFRGVAPDAKLLNGKVLNDFGEGQESWVIAGMEWAAASGADVVNMSLGGDPTDGTDIVSQAVNRITEETGTLFVVSSGNSGGLVGSPGSADAALTVGAVNRIDKLADFSSRGRVGGGTKPDVTAPGVGIVAAKAANGQIGSPAEDGYVSMSGTSMAAPHVSGAAAVLAGQHPDWTAAHLKTALMNTATPDPAKTMYQQGAGRVDVAEAGAATVLASVGSIDYGQTQWPHGDDQPVAKTITYTNTGTAPVTLDLTADVRNQGGSRAPQGMFTLTPATLTVPAGGQATTTVTADTSVNAPDGLYTGAVTATGGGQTVRTLVGVDREVESYAVTLKFVNHDGAPASGYFYQLQDVNNPKEYAKYDASGTVTLRLPKSEYFLAGAVSRYAPGTPDNHSAEFVEPALEVDGDMTFVVDARAAKPVTHKVDEPSARSSGSTEVEFTRETAWGSAYWWAPLTDGRGTLRPATTSDDTFVFTADAHLAKWNGTSFDGSPYLYHVRHTEKGTVPRTLEWTHQTRKLAKVRSTHAAARPGVVGIRDGLVKIPLPSTLTEYYTPDVPWTGATFHEFVEPDNYVSRIDQIGPLTFPLGRTTTVRWGQGVFGPSLSWPKSFRYRDELNLGASLTADQGRGRWGSSADTETATLLRDGKEIQGEWFFGPYIFTVEPDRAEYTFRMTADRPDARLSTQVSSEWTFTSGFTEGETSVPLLALRFAPGLDDHNNAPAGQRFTIPMYVERNGTAGVGRVNTPAVEVSYDDGRTWRPATVKRHGTEWKAVVDHPAGAEFVSLRSSVSDPDGNTQRQTIVRAYALT